MTTALRDLLSRAGVALNEGRPAGAEPALRHAIALEPAAAEALCLAGLAAHLAGRPDGAIRWFGRTVRLQPGNATAHSGLGEEFRRAGRLDEATRHGRLAAAIEPGDVNALHNLAITSYDRLEIGRSVACSRCALRLAPQMPGPHFELAEALLLSGRFEEGWDEYEWRFRLPGAPPPLPPHLLEARGTAPPPQWDGRPLPDGGRLLLVADQGFGDVIQFARYLPLVEALGPDLIVAASAEMVPILRQLVDEHRIHEDWGSLPDFQAWCALSGLPRLFGTTLETIPSATPYLDADPELAAWWKRRLDQLVPRRYRRIGLVWAGRPTHGNDHNRSLDLHRLAPLLDLDEVAFVSLQIGPAAMEIGRYFGRAPLINFGPEIADFDDTMAILRGLERLVSVDTAVAHLAGAMGVPVSLLLPFAPDWRWLLEQGDSPWYPVATLHRQTAPGCWDEPVREVAARLRAESRRRGAAQFPP
ncbi:glycosyltransferase [Azospirillum sp. YIM B02556]|uniref:Glycosyltransferase n=1 Tax=Azospirillum endophyticum TaxID=2800326 RepID=A0ABS1F7J9_9PROT|nr:glycosyltransferase [Azospirillum endophyticum]MBK1839408.1 glycosyltransferase [Azospirillum endophyticum]